MTIATLRDRLEGSQVVIYGLAKRQQQAGHAFS